MRVALYVIAALLAWFLLLMALSWNDTGRYQLRHVLERQLRDPDSAEYRDEVLYTHPDGSVFLCGEVNARNGLGGFAGFRRFVATSNYALIEDPSDSVTVGTLEDLRAKNCVY